MKDILLKPMFSILKTYATHDLPFLPERLKIAKIQKLLANLHDIRRICYTHKKFKTSIKPRISILKKWIESFNLIKGLVKTIYEHRAKKKCQKWY